MKISVIINTRNEEANIERAIKSVSSFADEIVVVDMESTDNTVEIAKKLGAQVFDHKLTNYVEPARNFAIKKATGDWIFILDADEEAPTKLLKQLAEIKEANTVNFVRVPRKNILFGKWMQYSRWWPDYNIRFFKKQAVTWDDEIHSIPVTIGEGVNIEPNEDFAIVHHNYQTVEQYIDRLNRYTTIQAAHLNNKGKEASVTSLIEKPMSEFLSRFFAGQGYKDGFHGLAVALLQSFSELVVYIKLWQLSKFKPEKIKLNEVVTSLKEAQKELNYWSADALVNEGAGITQKVKRKFKLH